MAMVTLNSTSDAKIPRILPYKTSGNLCDPSFSTTYFSGTEEASILQLAESNRNSKPSVSTANQHLYLVSKKVEENEIDVFNAEKYFNEEVVDENRTKVTNNGSHPILPCQKNDTSVGMCSVKLQPQPATPSIHSESSLNSRRALLHNIPKNHHLQKRNKSNRKSFLSALRCHCPCGDKNSVEIDEHIGINSPKKSSSSSSTRLVHGEARKSRKDGSEVEPRASPWIRQDFECRKLNGVGLDLTTEKDVNLFPPPNPKIGNTVLEMKKTEVVVLEDDNNRRKSLEVFGSPIHRNGQKSISLDRSLNILTWDAIVPKVDEIEIPAKSARKDTDTDSDASSDLFEIESFSTNPSQYLAREEAECMDSSITQANCYAPSEASIEWSVVTASVADYSAMSDTEELRSSTNNPRTDETLDMALSRKKLTRKEMQKRRPSILSGCNSNKAVNVAADVHRTNEKVIPGKQQQKSDFLMPMTRFHAENDLSCFDKRNGHFSYDASLITCSQPGWTTQVMHKH